MCVRARVGGRLRVCIVNNTGATVIKIIVMLLNICVEMETQRESIFLLLNKVFCGSFFFRLVPQLLKKERKQDQASETYVGMLRIYYESRAERFTYVKGYLLLIRKFRYAISPQVGWKQTAFV